MGAREETIVVREVVVLVYLITCKGACTLRSPVNVSCSPNLY